MEMEILILCIVLQKKLVIQKFGSYAGNNNSEGPFVYCGFKPALVMIKYTGSSQNWIVVDNKRPGYNLKQCRDSQNIKQTQPVLK